jgi:hypothetical protein
VESTARTLTRKDMTLYDSTSSFHHVQPGGAGHYQETAPAWSRPSQTGSYQSHQGHSQQTIDQVNHFAAQGDDISAVFIKG